MENSKPSISQLAIDEFRAVNELKFTARCKNDGNVYSYDLGARPKYESLRAITGVFVWALYKRRHHVGHTSRLTMQVLFWKFLNFLSEHGISELDQLDRNTLLMYARWLKNQPDLSYSTAASQYRGLAPYFLQMSKHRDVSSDFLPARNAFPKSSSLQTANAGYDQEELKSIIHAAVLGMREAMEKFNVPYQCRWRNKPAPVDDVAPASPRGGHSLWLSQEYKIWWWENNCQCQRLNTRQLARLPQGQGFIASFRYYGNPGIVGINSFYDLLGAGENYAPKYIGKPCPIKYTTPWKKMDYLVWYWENKLECQPLTYGTLKKVSPKLYGALKEYFGGRINSFFIELGFHRWISAHDLAPFYIMLLIRTQLNPSTIQRLTTACLASDPLTPEKKFLSWTKYRSSTRGKTIPSDASRDGWPVMLVGKVLRITEFIRDKNQECLWITNANRYRKTLPLGVSGLKNALTDFSRKYQLTHSSGEPLLLQAKLIRPTMAWQEYLRTEDIRYLQSLLGHEKVGTTADYLRRVSDPILKIRRGVHQQAMFLGLTNSDESQGIASAKVTSGLLNSCKNPLDSPISAQRAGGICSAGHEVCLSCPNLVITYDDIKKHYCYINYHEQLLSSGLITNEEYTSAAAEKIFIWENQILPRYPSHVIDRIRKDAELNPIGIWSPTSEGTWL